MTGRENADQCCRESHQRERKTFPTGGEQQSSPPPGRHWYHGCRVRNPARQGRRAATPATTTSRSSEWCSSANPRTAARLSSDPSNGLGRVAQLTDVLLGGAGCFEERLLKRCGAGREFMQHQTDVGRQLAYPRRIDAAQGG